MLTPAHKSHKRDKTQISTAVHLFDLRAQIQQQSEAEAGAGASE